MSVFYVSDTSITLGSLNSLYQSNLVQTSSVLGKLWSSILVTPDPLTLPASTADGPPHFIASASQFTWRLPNDTPGIEDDPLLTIKGTFKKYGYLPEYSQMGGIAYMPGVSTAVVKEISLTDGANHTVFQISGMNLNLMKPSVGYSDEESALKAAKSLYGKISTVQFDAADNNVTLSESLGVPVDGGAGNDTLYGSSGIDLLRGGAGDDFLFGGAGNDILSGGDGDDLLTGGDGVDRLEGGKGNDAYEVNLVLKAGKAVLEDKIVESGNDTKDILRLVTADDGSGGHVTLSLAKATTIALAPGLENLDAWYTGATLINLTGNAANNYLTGNEGDNVLSGGKGNDILQAHLGNDTLIGGLGNDTLWGGSGQDVFRFESPAGAANMDTITDFTSGEDIIQLARSSFAKLKGVTDIAAVLVQDAPTLPSQYLVFKYGTTSANAGTLYYDADGSGPGAALAIVELTGVHELKAADLVIV